MSKQYPCRILAGKRVAIPKPIVQSLGWKDGDYVMVKFNDNNLEVVGVEFKEKHFCLNQVMEGDYECKICNPNDTSSKEESKV